ncbi:MAG TPA: YbhB/YbcL family Raf kinase inhibitor-like protein [Acetobacteraceae bacterium]|nr:YbhB/YbcL family Raf kinase inhibitor-like protein [Acetobacteraceae bacterium]
MTAFVLSSWRCALLSGAALGLVGCNSAAPASPTTPPAAAPTVAPATSPAAKPVVSPSPAASPSAVIKPAASPAASVGPSPSAAASASPAISNAAYVTAILFTGSATSGFTLQTPAFTNGGTIPTMYTCAGANGGTSPQLSWSGAPANTQSLALVEQDADTATPNTHWLVYNIPPSVTQLDAGQPTETPTLPNGAMQGQDHAQGIFAAFALIGYEGACPPPGAAAHHYTFQLFALDGMVPLKPGATINDLKTAMAGHMVGQTELIGLFSR